MSPEIFNYVQKYKFDLSKKKNSYIYEPASYA